MPVNNVLLNRIALAITFLNIAVWVRAEPTEKEDPRLPPPILTTKPLETTPQDDAQQKLLKALYNERQPIAAASYKESNRIHLSAERVLDPTRQLLRTGMELYRRPEDQLKLLKEISEVADRLENIVNLNAGTLKGAVVDLERHKLRAFKLEIELETLKVKKAAGKK